MPLRVSFTCLFLVALLLFPLTKAKSVSQSPIGVGMVPSTGQNGDEEEKLMTKIVSEIPEVAGHLYAPQSAGAIFSTLLKLKEEGRRINFLIIAGHGSAAKPHIAFPGGDLGPETVNLPQLRQNLARYEQILKRAQDPQSQSKACEHITELREQIKHLESISEVMTPGAMVFLLNCSPAATAAGEEFVKNLGEVLLSKNGGKIIASRNDTDLFENGFFSRVHANLFSGSATVTGNYGFGGNFVTFPVARRPETQGGDQWGTLRVRVLANESPLAGVKVTVQEKNQNVPQRLRWTSSGVTQSFPLEMRVPATRAGTADFSTTGERKFPEDYIRYEVRAEHKDYQPEVKEVMIAGERDQVNCKPAGATELVIRLATKRAAAPCTTDSLGGELGSVIPSLPFFGQSSLARSGKPLTSPLRMSYSVEDANGAVSFSGPAKILFSAGWSIGCAASGQAQASGYGRNACDGFQLYGAKGTVVTGLLGENSCVASASIRGAQDINFSGDPYLGSAKVVAITASTSISVDVSVAIHAGAAHGARDKPDVIAAVKKAAEDWAKVIAARLQGNTGIPRGASPAIIAALLPDVIRNPDSSALQGYFAQAKSSLQRRDLDGAQTQFEQAYLSTPNSAALNYNLSWVYQAQDKPLTALKHAEHYLRLAPAAADRADVEARMADLQEELRRNPRTVTDSSGCRDVLSWAQTEQDVAKRGRDVARRQAVLEVLIAAQRGECENARRLQAGYKQRFGSGL
jgi:hypothetical protein